VAAELQDMELWLCATKDSNFTFGSQFCHVVLNCKSSYIFLFNWKSKFKSLLLCHTCKLHFRLDLHQASCLDCMNYTVLNFYFSSSTHILDSMVFLNTLDLTV